MRPIQSLSKTTLKIFFQKISTRELELENTKLSFPQNERPAISNPDHFRKKFLVFETFQKIKLFQQLDKMPHAF
jgi:hypothetical protein